MTLLEGNRRSRARIVCVFVHRGLCAFIFIYSFISVCAFVFAYNVYSIYLFFFFLSVREVFRFRLSGRRNWSGDTSVTFEKIRTVSNGGSPARIIRENRSVRTAYGSGSTDPCAEGRLRSVSKDLHSCGQQCARVRSKSKTLKLAQMFKSKMFEINYSISKQ